MRSLTLLLIPLLFLSSCSIDWNDEKDKKIVELEKQVTELKEKNDDEIFKKNIECSKKDLWDTSAFNNHEIFYSPVRKSCIFIATVVKNENTSNEQVNWWIIDIVTNETILLLIYKNDEVMKLTNYNSWTLSKLTVNEAKCIFNRKVRDLKQRNWTENANYFQSATHCN